MAYLGKRGTETDPWRSSGLISAMMELFLSVLTLLSVAIAFIIAQFANFFGLKSPCVHFGCPHHSPHDDAIIRCSHSYFPNSCSDSRLQGESMSPAIFRYQYGCHIQRRCSHACSKNVRDDGRRDLDTGMMCSGGLCRKRSYAAFVSVSPDRDLDDENVPSFSATCISHENSNADEGDSEPLTVPAEGARRGSSLCSVDRSTGGIDRLSHDARTTDQDGEAGVRCCMSNRSSVLFGKMQSSPPIELDADDKESLEMNELCDNSLLKPRESHSPLQVHLETAETKQPPVTYSTQVSPPSKQLAMENIDGWFHDIEEECMQNSSISLQRSRTGDVKHKVLDGFRIYEEGEHQDAAFPVIDGENLDDLQQSHITSLTKLDVDEVGAEDQNHSGDFTPVMLHCEAQQEEEDVELEIDAEESVESLRRALLEEKKMLAALEEELENERNAAAIATNEAMAMISRLQEEKSTMQMEVAQLQRISEEKAEYDEQAMELLKEILLRREREKFALEKEVELYREKLVYDQVGKQKRSISCKHCWEATEKTVGSVELLSGSHGQDTSSFVTHCEELLSGSHGHDTSPAISKLGLENTFSPQLSTEEPTDGKLRLNNENIQKNCAISNASWGMQGIVRASHGLQRNSLVPEIERKPADDEETQFTHGGMWLLEELQDPHRLGTESDIELYDPHSLDHNLVKRNATSSSAELRVEKVGESEEYGDKAEIDAVARGEVFPVHDVYEVQCASEVELKEIEECHNASEDSEEMSYASPGWLTQEHNTSKFTRRKSVQPPRFPIARQLFAPEKKTALEQNKSFSSQHPITSRGNVTEVEDIHVRLEALEADRNLLREALQTFKRSDEEFKLLQEITQHLKQLAK